MHLRDNYFDLDTFYPEGHELRIGGLKFKALKSLEFEVDIDDRFLPARINATEVLRVSGPTAHENFRSA